MSALFPLLSRHDLVGSQHNFILSFYFSLFVEILEITHEAAGMSGKCSATEVQSQALALEIRSTSILFSHTAYANLHSLIYILINSALLSSAIHFLGKNMITFFKHSTQL